MNFDRKHKFLWEIFEKRVIFYEALELITANLQILSKEGLPSDGKETEND